MTQRLLCLACSQEIEVAPNANLSACPNCGDTGIPADLVDRVGVLVTWHELRVLVIWAEFWASAKDDAEHERMRRVVYGIADRLQAQHLERAGLTFKSELGDLREAFGRVEQNVVIEDGLHRGRGDRDKRDAFPEQREGEGL